MGRSDLGFHCNRLQYLGEAIIANGLSRGEFYNFDVEELPELRRVLLSANLTPSIHSPLIRPEWYPDPPTWSFLCDIDRDSRDLTFRMIEETLIHAEDIGAEYIVVHFPTLSTDGAGEDEAKLEGIAWRSCDRLAELSIKRGIPIHIEGLGNSPYLTTGFLGQALSQYPLRYCFDIGHMHVASQTNGFDLYEFAAGIASFVGSIHLWNNRGSDDYKTFRHIPVHPCQDPSEGWADIRRLMEVLSPSCPVIFESFLLYPESLGPYDYRDGVKWVRDILATLS